MVKLSNIRMKPKLIAMFLLVGVVPLAVVTGVSFFKAGRALEGSKQQASEAL